MVKRKLISTVCDDDFLLFPSIIDENSSEELLEKKEKVSKAIDRLTLGKPLVKLSCPALLTCNSSAAGNSGSTHHDFLLQEMKWMAADFSQERKWRGKKSKKIAKIVLSFHLKKSRAKKNEQKLIEQNLKRKAARIGRDVKKFWTKIDKIIAYKNQLEVEEQKKKIMDKHLRNLVNETEKYSSSLTASFSNELTKGINISINSSNNETKSEAEGDFVPDNEESDDETTLAAAEKFESKEAQREEAALLLQESDMSIDELRAHYAKLASMASDEDDVEFESDEHDSSEEFQRSHEMEIDRKSTIIGETVVEQTRKDENNFRNLNYPFLLSKNLVLREYQEIGFQWLSSIYKKRVNGILADEMGLGKTIQTICLLAHLACNLGIWGPHLIVVPTSCMLNWEMEFKRWCPGFKLLTYYGGQKRRKELRLGWSKSNSFQICITSYQLVVQDAHCFKRKKWYYMILDEAHNIKNWKSQRWQTLLTFNSQRRLLLTGTPLQNNLIELWSLMHFLMPHIFRSRKEFSYWFNNPLNSMVEGESSVNETLVSRLHGIIRPFVLRRLKKDVAKQLPKKHEHIIMCSLSKRQRFLYEDFISRSSTRKAMSGGNFMGMMNALMQLRKVCNHPDLFEVRPIVSSFSMESLDMVIPPKCDTIWFSYYKQQYHGSMYLYTNNLFSLSCQQMDFYAATRCRQLATDPLIPSTTSPDSNNQRLLPTDVRKYIIALHARKHEYLLANYQHQLYLHHFHVTFLNPMLGADAISQIRLPMYLSAAMNTHRQKEKSSPKTVLWEMVLNEKERKQQFQYELMNLLVYVPKALGQPPQRAQPTSESILFEDMIAAPFRSAYHDIRLRNSISFPEKRLLQYDCGKLQALDRLLRQLKKKKARCLIFTQMSSMLNILEIFLNIHGHTYFRLDGSTKVEKRQQLMDRFNQDNKIFCFILSTRSGGLGINLTGANAVIFYDSDWNPAMDAQAQDRAHRIGQTREVHIYRLISEQTVEENILKIAQQKRHLDFLVMSEGQFTTDFFTKTSLKELMGAEALKNQPQLDNLEDTHDHSSSSFADVEKIMVTLEDEEDVQAMRDVREEVNKENLEFEEHLDKNGEENGNIVIVESNNHGGEKQENETKPATIDKKLRERGRGRRGKKSNLCEGVVNCKYEEHKREYFLEKEQEKALQDWKKSVSLSHFEKGLKGIDKYALHFKQGQNSSDNHTDLSTTNAAEIEAGMELDVVNIEAAQESEEQQQIEDGELITGKFSSMDIEDNDRGTAYKKKYIEFRRHSRQDRKRRWLTGENWIIKKCSATQYDFYYNIDTLEATWDKPTILCQQESLTRIRQSGYAHLSLLPGVCEQIALALSPVKERHMMAQVCSQWHQVLQSNQGHFYRKVTIPDQVITTAALKCFNSSSAEASELYHPGETLILNSGIYSINEPVLINIPVRIQPAPGAIVKFCFGRDGQITWMAHGGEISAIYFENTEEFEPQQENELHIHSSSSPHMISVLNGGQLTVNYCDFNGRNRWKACVHVGGSSGPLPIAKKNGDIPSCNSKTIEMTSSSANNVKLNLNVNVSTTDVRENSNTAASTKSTCYNNIDLSKVPNVSASTEDHCDRSSILSRNSSSIQLNGISSCVPSKTVEKSNHSNGLPTHSLITESAKNSACSNPLLDFKAKISTLTLTHSRIYNSGGSGVFCSDGASIIVYGNEIYDNCLCGLSLESGFATIKQNMIYGNSEFGVRIFEFVEAIDIEFNNLLGNKYGSFDMEKSKHNWRIRNNHREKASQISAEYFPPSKWKFFLKKQLFRQYSASLQRQRKQKSANMDNSMKMKTPVLYGPLNRPPPSSITKPSPLLSLLQQQKRLHHTIKTREEETEKKRKLYAPPKKQKTNNLQNLFQQHHLYQAGSVGVNNNSYAMKNWNADPLTLRGPIAAVTANQKNATPSKLVINKTDSKPKLINQPKNNAIHGYNLTTQKKMMLLRQQMPQPPPLYPQKMNAFNANSNRSSGNPNKSAVTTNTPAPTLHTVTGNMLSGNRALQASPMVGTITNLTTPPPSKTVKNPPSVPRDVITRPRQPPTSIANVSSDPTSSIHTSSFTNLHFQQQFNFHYHQQMHMYNQMNNPIYRQQHAHMAAQLHQQQQSLMINNLAPTLTQNSQLKATYLAPLNRGSSSNNGMNGKKKKGE